MGSRPSLGRFLQFCPQDYHFLQHCTIFSPDSDCSDNSDGGPRTKTKRVRTTFTEEQLQVLQANFQLDSNPDGQDLERIAQITGLSKRVTQVWFQNSRARQKKHQGNGKPGGGLNNNNSMHSAGDPQSPTGEVMTLSFITTTPPPPCIT